MGLSRGILRSAATLCIATCVCALAACSGGAAGDIVGKQWQVTQVFDDPQLPSRAPSDGAGPSITFGRESYTVSSACGNLQGTVEWNEEAVTLGKPSVMRNADCDASTRVFSDRFRAQLQGQFMYENGQNGLKISRIGNFPQGQAAPGWAAVSVD